jgi:hypothetical protein
MKAATKQRIRKRASVVPQVSIATDNGDHRVHSILSPSNTQGQHILDDLAVIGIAPALSQKLQDLFGLRFEQLQSFWGLYSALCDDVGLQVSPDEVLYALNGPLKQRLRRENDVSVDGNTHVDTIEVFRFLVGTLRNKPHATKTAFGLVTAQSGFISEYSQEDEKRALIHSALLEKNDSRVAPKSDSEGQEEVSYETRHAGADEADAMQQVVRGAVARLRCAIPSSGSTVPPPALLPKETGPQQHEFTASDVELVWEHLFARRRTDEGIDRTDAHKFAMDDVYNNLPAELRALLAGGGAHDGGDSDSAAGSHGDRRGDSMYLRNGRTITRLASKASIRKAFMHNLDFSKGRGGGSDDDTSVGSPRGEDSFGFSATIVLDNDNILNGGIGEAGVDSANGKKPPPPPSVLDAVKQLENDLEANARECQDLLEGHGVLSERDEIAARLAEQELLSKQAALLARYRSSIVTFQERKRTTRLQSLLAANSATGDGSSGGGAVMSRTMSAFDFGDRNSSVDNAEIRPFLSNEDPDAPTQHETLTNDSFGAYVPVTHIKQHGAHVTTIQNTSNTAGIGKKAHEHGGQSPNSDVVTGERGDSCRDPLIPGERGVNNPASRPGSSGTTGSVRQWSTATTDLRPVERSKPLPVPLVPSSHPSSGGEEDVYPSSTLAKVAKVSRRRNHDEIRRIRDHSQILTKSEKHLLHSKRLSADALKRECVALPMSVQQLLPSSAAKVVERMRGTSTQLPPRAVSAVPSRRASDILSLPRPHSSQGGAHRSTVEGAPILRASTPATRVSTPQWSHIVAPPASLLTAIPTITCSPPQDNLTLPVSVVSHDDFANTIQSSTNNNILAASIGSTSFLQVPERPGTAPRRLTPFSLTTAALPHDVVEFRSHSAQSTVGCVSPPVRSAVSSIANSLVPSRSTSPTKELQHLPWPPSPIQGPMLAPHNGVTLSHGLITDGAKNWNRWLQGGGDVTHAKAGIVKSHRRANNSALL